MGKVRDKQQYKRQMLLETAFHLFTSKGINETTIQDIAREAGVAKGTFYLYFKDKYDLIEKLRAKKAAKLFEDAVQFSRRQEYENFTEQFLIIVDYIIDELTRNKDLLKFIYKNLSIGGLNIRLEGEEEIYSSTSIYEMFEQRALEERLILKDPKTVFFMIIELVGSTCYTSILLNIPLPIEEYKPYLYEAIKKLLS